MTDAPMAKRAKIDDADDADLDQLTHIVWEHYRNFLDSIDEGEDEEGEGGEDGDIDELQELIEIAEARVAKPALPVGESAADSDIGDSSVQIVYPNWQSRKEMIPILLSVAYYHLADDSISRYLSMQQEKQQSSGNEKGGENEDPIAQTMEMAQNLVVKSLEWYPYNAATWSMGANFGRMSQSLSISSTRKWYEMAVRASTVLRERALEALNDESIPDEEKEWIELLVLNQILGVEYEDDDDEEEDGPTEQEDQNEANDGDKRENNDENDEKHGEDDNDDAEETGSYSASAVESTSRFMCAMLLSRDGRHDRALNYLKPFRLTHRLHPNVWKILSPSNPTTPTTAPTKPPLVFQPKGGVIPSHLYESMTKVFAPDAAFWRESEYSTRGYYSFFHDLDATEKKQPCNLIEEVIINHLLPRAQQCLESIASDDEETKSDGSTTICGFEWWAHTRPIQANLGHNLHFDTDESMLDQEGKVTHPILSSVLYLTGGSEDSSSPAGATIILDETPDSTKVGGKCWQGIPKDNSFLIFPGNRLHGVLPCPGIQKQGEEETPNDDKTPEVASLIHNWKNRKMDGMSGGAPASCSEDPPHRLTFMVGFWTRSVPATMKHRTLYGPCGPLPSATEEHTWVSEITHGYEDPTAKRPVANNIMSATALSQVSPAWEIIETKQEENEDSHIDLVIPHGIDHRFFVHGAPECFRQSLFEDRETNH